MTFDFYHMQLFSRKQSSSNLPKRVKSEAAAHAALGRQTDFTSEHQEIPNKISSNWLLYIYIYTILRYLRAIEQETPQINTAIERKD